MVDMSTASQAYLEIIDFIASGTTSASVAAFHPSQEAQTRVRELLEREKFDALCGDEIAELDHYLELEHILRMAKARARQLLASST